MICEHIIVRGPMLVLASEQHARMLTGTIAGEPTWLLSPSVHVGPCRFAHGGKHRVLQLAGREPTEVEQPLNL